MKARINNDVRSDSFNNVLLLAVEDVANTVLVNLTEGQAAKLLSHPSFQQFSTFEAEIDLGGCEPSPKGYLIPKSIRFLSALNPPSAVQKVEDFDVLTGGVEVLPEAMAQAKEASARRQEFINARRRAVSSSDAF